MIELDWEEIDPDGLRGTSPPDLNNMRVDELCDFAIADHVHRNKAIFELLDRAGSEADAARAAGYLGKLPIIQDDRMHNGASMAWAVMSSLLAAETSTSRSAAYEVFGSLGPDEQKDVLAWLKVDGIEAAHPG